MSKMAPVRQVTNITLTMDDKMGLNSLVHNRNTKTMRAFLEDWAGGIRDLVDDYMNITKTQLATRVVKVRDEWNLQRDLGTPEARRLDRFRASELAEVSESEAGDSELSEIESDSEERLDDIEVLSEMPWNPQPKNRMESEILINTGTLPKEPFKGPFVRGVVNMQL
jgi:hypothetical protein